MTTLVLDAGSSIIKGRNVNEEVSFPHTIQPLTEEQKTHPNYDILYLE